MLIRLIKIRFYLLFSLILFLSISLISQNKDALRMMTYNIRYAGNEESDGINAWSKRKDLIASMIEFHHADIVGVQEALLLQLDDLKKLLPAYSWIGVGRDDGKNKGEFSAILFRHDRFEVKSQSTFWLSDNPDTPSVGWDAAYPRVVTWAKIKDKKTKKIFYVFNTHFDHIGVTARNNSSKLLKKRISEIVKKQPVILMGDFNTQDTTEAYKVLTDSENESPRLYDSQFISKTRHHGSHVSFNGFGTSIEPGNKIDFIFVTKNVEVLQHGVIDEVVDGRYPSDHMPVLAEVRIR